MKTFFTSLFGRGRKALAAEVAALRAELHAMEARLTAALRSPAVKAAAEDAAKAAVDIAVKDATGGH